MIRTSLILMTLFVLNSGLHAELLVFKEIESGFIAASPGRANITVRGYFVYESGTGRMSEIGITTLGGTRYYIINTHFGEHAISTVSTPPRDQMILSRAY